MNQDSDLNSPQQSSPTLQESPACLDPPRGVVRQLNDRTAPSLPLQLPLFLEFPQPPKKSIDRVLARLSRMELPGKGYVEDYLRHQYRRNFKLNTLRSTLTACQLFLSFLKDGGKASL